MTGEPEPHFASVGLMVGQASLSNGGGKMITYGLSANLNFDPHWQLGGQFNIMSPQSKFQSLTNFDAAVKYLQGNWNAGILLGINLARSADDSESINFNSGVTGGYDWKIPKTDLSVGPQVDLLWSPIDSGLTTLDMMVALRYSF